jgi:TRAP-type mannitol/chloroaromatic compound transport system substrate-binding protein
MMDAQLARVGSLCLLAGSLALPAAAQETWRIQTALPSAHAVHVATEEWAEDVARMTGGRLTIEISPGGAVVPPGEMIDAVTNGILDGMATSSVYFAGRDRAFAVLGDLIAGYQDWTHALAFCEYGGGKELYRELYAQYGAYTIGCGNSGVESLVAAKPIRSIDDFQGVKIRSPEGMAAELFRRIGASPVALPPTEVFTSLDRSVIDAADYSSYAMNASLGFHKIAKNPILHFHSLPIYEITVNKAKWDAQPEDIQAILEMSVRDLSVQINLKDLIAERIALVQDREAGVEAIEWSEEELSRLRAEAAQVWEEFAAGSPMAQKAYDAQVGFMRQMGLLD